MTTQYPEVPQAQVQVPVTVEPELSIDDLATQAAQSNFGLEHGKYRVKVTDFEWKYSRDEVAMGHTGLPKAGRAVLNYVVTDVVVGNKSQVGKKGNLGFHFKSGTSAGGFNWNGERDAIGFLVKHGITTAQLNSTAVVGADGVRNSKSSYSQWFSYLGDFGGEYVIELKENKNDSEKTSEFIRETPVCFDDAGNALPKPMPTVPTAAVQAPQAVPVAAQPVAPVEVAVPVAAPVAVEVAPVAPVAPVAEVPAPVAVPQAVPQAVPTPAPVAVAPVAVPTAVPQAVPQAVAPAGIPPLPGM